MTFRKQITPKTKRETEALSFFDANAHFGCGTRTIPEFVTPDDGFKKIIRDVAPLSGTRTPANR